MRRLFSRLKELTFNGWSWSFDYTYITYHQIAGFFSRAKPNKYRTPVGGKGSIILIPGIYEKWHVMKPVADILHQQGYDVHIIEALGYGVGTVEAMAKVLDEYITASGLTRCVIVAHSKGGLVGKYALATYNKKGIIKGLVALNTPFMGSQYAYLAPIKPIRVFIPTSPTLQSLQSNILVNEHIISIYGRFDPHIPLGSRLEGAENIMLDIRGHFRVISNPQVHKAILNSVSRLLQNGKVNE